MSTQKMEVLISPRWGFSNVISTTFGIVVVVGLTLVALYKVFMWLWPTLKWIIPLIAIFLYFLWSFYKATKASDDVARTHRQYQAMLVIVRSLIILTILLADTHTVSG